MTATTTTSFIVTGFGPFRGVPENPTTILVQALIGHLQTQEEEATEEEKSSIPMSKRVQSRIIETSYIAVQREIDDIYNELVAEVVGNTSNTNTSTTTNSKRSSSMIILLHLGVNCGSTTYQIETCAYNEMNFTIPDESNHQPQHCCITTQNPYQSILQTPFVSLLLPANSNTGTTNANEMLSSSSSSTASSSTTTTTAATTPSTTTAPPTTTTNHLRGSRSNNNSIAAERTVELQQQPEKYGTTFIISTNPGRFVCNYIYYYSLNTFLPTVATTTAAAAVAAITTPDNNDDDDDDDTATTKPVVDLPTVKCLFLHVPPFTVASPTQQLQFITDLMRLLEQQQQ